MTKRRWIALAVLLGVSVTLGSGGEPANHNLTGEWQYRLWGHWTDLAGEREFVRETSYLYIDHCDGFAWLYMDGFGELPAVVGRRYLVASEGEWYDGEVYCVLLNARIAGAKGRQLRGQLKFFEMWEDNCYGEGYLGSFRFWAQRVSDDR